MLTDSPLYHCRQFVIIKDSLRQDLVQYSIPLEIKLSQLCVILPQALAYSARGATKSAISPLRRLFSIKTDCTAKCN